MSSLAVFPSPALPESVTLSEYNSSLIIGDHTKERTPNFYTFGQVHVDRRVTECYCSGNSAVA